MANNTIASSTTVTTTTNLRARWRDYFELTKPRVVALMLVTAWVGMHLAVPVFVPISTIFIATIGIALAAGAAAVLNHIVDRHIDTKMRRTERRPIATGRVAIKEALIFAAIIGITGLSLLAVYVNTLTAILSALTLIGYGVVYTLYLKHATPQNIVIGGLAGAAPPLLGWVAVTNQIDPQALLLVLIIFVWTPPHFWALAIHRHEDYAKAKVPMLPVTHGIPFTKTCILLYTILLLPITIFPFLIGMSGWLYLIGALALGSGFLYYAVKLKFGHDRRVPYATFKYSITYLFALFVLLLLDHYLLPI